MKEAEDTKLSSGRMETKGVGVEGNLISSDTNIVKASLVNSYMKKKASPTKTHKSMAEVLRGKSTKGGNTIRLRFDFKGEQSDYLHNARGDEVKRVLHKELMMAKKIKLDTKSLPWEVGGDEIVMIFNDVDLFSPTMVMVYMDIPVYATNFVGPI